MQRDPELIRRILLKIEEFPFPNQYMSFHFEDVEPLDLVYHVTLLMESGLIEAEANRYSCFNEWSNIRLTWRGHELLELIREESRWQEALAQIGQHGGGQANFEVLKNFLTQSVILPHVTT